MINKTIIFPHLNITLHNVSDGISLFGHEIAFYGLIIACAMLVGVSLTMMEAKRVGVSTDDYLDIAIATIICGVLGARVYYVIFSWSYYKDSPIDIFKIWEGGLAIYGGIIFGALTVFVMCKIKKLPFPKVADIAILAVLVGQIAGRWGNFFNREAFGEYTDSLFAMMLPIVDVRSYGDITTNMFENIQYIDGVGFISVHPTFLYESFVNLCILIFLLCYRKHKKFDGELALMYGLGYGILRFFVERLRTDQLLIAHTSIPVSQLLSGIIVVVCATVLVKNYLKKPCNNA